MPPEGAGKERSGTQTSPLSPKESRPRLVRHGRQVDRRVRPSRALEVSGLGLISDAAAAGSLRAQGFQTALGQGEGGAGGQRPRAWHPEAPGLRGGQPQQEFGRRVSALLLARRAAAPPRGVRWAAGAERSEGGELPRLAAQGAPGALSSPGRPVPGHPGEAAGPEPGAAAAAEP